MPGCAQEDDDLAGIGGGGKKTKFSRLAWGLELWDLICIAVELMYEPELQVSRVATHREPCLVSVHSMGRLLAHHDSTYSEGLL